MGHKADVSATAKEDEAPHQAIHVLLHPGEVPAWRGASAFSRRLFSISIAGLPRFTGSTTARL